MVHAGLAFLADGGRYRDERRRSGRAACGGWSRPTRWRRRRGRRCWGRSRAGQDYADDGDYSPCSWLMHRTQVTKGAAADHTAWLKRGAAHPRSMAALAAEAISKSYAREICWWTDKLPEDARAAADEILLGAAASGLGLADLAGLAAEMYERSRQDKPDTDGRTVRTGTAGIRVRRSMTGR